MTEENKPTETEVVEALSENPENTAKALIDATAWGGQVYSALMALTGMNVLSHEQNEGVKNVLRKAPTPIAEVGSKLFFDAYIQRLTDSHG